MNEMLKLAQERHDQIAKNISQREADIQSLRAEAEKLETFVTLAKELFGKKMKTAEPPTAEKAPHPAETSAKVMPVRHVQTA